MARRRGKSAKKQRNATVWGIPLVKKDQIADKAEQRNRNADPEKVRKRVAELLGTTDGGRTKSPAKETSKKAPSKAGRVGQARKTSTPAGPKTWKCPNCLKRVDIGKGVVLVEHQNARGERCRGSGYQVPQTSTDALDYRVAGSFEGGRGRR
jgi:hypothetical protein